MTAHSAWVPYARERTLDTTSSAIRIQGRLMKEATDE